MCLRCKMGWDWLVVAIGIFSMMQNVPKREKCVSMVRQWDNGQGITGQLRFLLRLLPDIHKKLLRISYGFVNFIHKTPYYKYNSNNKEGLAIDCCGTCGRFLCNAIMTRPYTTVLDKEWLRWKKESNTN